MKDSPSKDFRKKIEEESESIGHQLTTRDPVILLDSQGKSFTSPGLAGEIQKINNRGISNLVLVIGGAYGLGDPLKKRAHSLLSLSTLTLPHELARVVLPEQLDRAHTILRGEKYHH